MCTDLEHTNNIVNVERATIYFSFRVKMYNLCAYSEHLHTNDADTPRFRRGDNMLSTHEAEADVWDAF